MRGSLHMKTFDHRVVPTSGLDELIVDESVKEKLRRIERYREAYRSQPLSAEERALADCSSELLVDTAE